MSKSPPITMILMVSLILSIGCAKKDWIQTTLVTAHVTGAWLSSGGNLQLKLEQQGPKVTGSMTWRGIQPANMISGAIEGDVGGDLFRFKQTSGTDMGVQGEMTVSGEEMTGIVRTAIGHRVQVLLQRTDSSPPSRSQ